MGGVRAEVHLGFRFGVGRGRFGVFRLGCLFRPLMLWGVFVTVTFWGISCDRVHFSYFNLVRVCCLSFLHFKVFVKFLFYLG